MKITPNDAVCSLCYKKGCNFFTENKGSIIYGKNAETKQQVRHMRQARLRAAELQRQNPLVSLYLFFLTGAGAVNVFSVFPFSFHKKEHILTALKIN